MTKGEKPTAVRRIITPPAAKDGVFLVFHSRRPSKNPRLTITGQTGSSKLTSGAMPMKAYMEPPLTYETIKQPKICQIEPAQEY